jgi:hypothetical protein
VGNEGMWVVGLSGSWEKLLHVDLCEFPVVLAKPRNSFLSGVWSQLEFDPLLSAMISVV